MTATKRYVQKKKKKKPISLLYKLEPLFLPRVWTTDTCSSSFVSQVNLFGPLAIEATVGTL